MPWVHVGTRSCWRKYCVSSANDFQRSKKSEIEYLGTREILSRTQTPFIKVQCTSIVTKQFELCPSLNIHFGTVVAPIICCFTSSSPPFLPPQQHPDTITNLLAHPNRTPRRPRLQQHRTLRSVSRPLSHAHHRNCITPITSLRLLPRTRHCHRKASRRGFPPPRCPLSFSASRRKEGRDYPRPGMHPRLPLLDGRLELSMRHLPTSLPCRMLFTVGFIC